MDKRVEKVLSILQHPGPAGKELLEQAVKLIETHDWLEAFKKSGGLPSVVLKRQKSLFEKRRQEFSRLLELNSLGEPDEVVLLNLACLICLAAETELLVDLKRHLKALLQVKKMMEKGAKIPSKYLTYMIALAKSEIKLYKDRAERFSREADQTVPSWLIENTINDAIASAVRRPLDCYTANILVDHLQRPAEE